MPVIEEPTGVPVEDGPRCGHWMRRQQAYCARKPHSSGQHSAAGDAVPTEASTDAVCGYWMKIAKDTCGRKPNHPGKHITPKALKQQVDNRPRKTTRRVGVRLSDDPRPGSAGTGRTSSSGSGSPRRSSSDVSKSRGTPAPSAVIRSKAASAS